MTQPLFNVITLSKKDLLPYMNKRDVTHLTQREMKEIAHFLHDAIMQGTYIEAALKMIIVEMGYEVK